MRTIAAVLVLSCLGLTAVRGQAKKQSAEIGMSLGVTILSASGSTITTVGIPVDAGPLPLFARPAMYATIFVTPSVMIEPQVAFSNISGGGSTTFTMLLIGSQFGYLVSPEQRSSVYFAANAAFQHLSANGTASGLGVGGALGYRFAVGKGLALRLEGRYRRWLNDFDGINEIGFSLGIGGII
jgi:hypothetical protein